MIRVEASSSITTFAPAGWDAMAGRNILASHGWLRTLEEMRHSPMHRRYWAVRDSQGLAGALYGSVPRPRRVAQVDRLLFGRLATPARYLGLKLAPALFCGAHGSYGEPLILRPGLPVSEQATLTRALVEAAEGCASENGWTLFFRDVPRADDRFRTRIGLNGYLVAAELPSACIDVRWNSFEEYRLDLKRTHRATEKNVREQINRARRAGVVFERLQGSAMEDPRLHAVLDAHHLRLNGTPFPFATGWLARAGELLGDRLLVLAARCDDALVGACVVLCSDDASHLKFIGVDHRHPQRSATYHGLCFYEPIRHAIRTGRRRLYLGKLAYDPKIKRGGTLLEVDMLCRARNPLHAALLRASMARRTRRVARRIAHLRTL